MKENEEDSEPGTASTGTSTDATMPQGSARASRNLAEKHRRDNLNANINIMATMVPSITESSRRQDKISILRLAGAFLRSYFTIGPKTPGFLPEKYSNIDLEENFIDSFEAPGGFCIVVTMTGNIVYISPRVEHSLGHLPSEMMGKSLYFYVHPDDHKELTKALTPDECLPTITDVTQAEQSSNSSDDPTSLQDSFQEQRRNFNVKIAQRINSKGEHTRFKCFHVSGILRLSYFRKNKVDKQLNSTSNDIIFVGIARYLQRRINELSLMEANKQEYVTRHLIDGRIIFSDHRIGIVAGYMTEEVSGVNAFSFMHKDDVRYTIMALRQLYDRREGFGTSCYRLLSKTGGFIYLKTHGYLEFNKKDGTFSSFVCINTLVEKEEGEKRIKDLKERFSATISHSDTPMIENGNFLFGHSTSPAVEDPAQLEDVISKLIGDIASPSPSPDTQEINPLTPDMQSAPTSSNSQSSPSPATKNIESSSKNKAKRIKLESAGSNGHSSTSCEALDSSPTNPISYRIPDKILSGFSDSSNEADSIVGESPSTNQSPVESSHNYVFRGKEIYETMLEPNTILDQSQCVPNILNLTHEQCDNSSDSTLLFIKNEMIDNPVEKEAIKRTYSEDDCTLSKKKQRSELYENNKSNNSFQNIIKVNPDFLKILDELGQVINSEPNAASGDIHKFATDQMDETLRKTYSHLEDRINCQESQINKLELVLESPSLQSQRGNFNQIQAEHEIQKKIIKTLQQKQYNTKPDLKQNIGV